ncbi:hypothetical protein [Bradyrhizobium sp. ORS 285]|uniref:hypothetical protein n=1 Tax=Bradyrhizobium sp. ORS 285 TaxID=115808 RepID=UPI0002E03A54|nr:hypothetical protein [Bradyrhizobium sp. ORS 285]
MGDVINNDGTYYRIVEESLNPTYTLTRGASSLEEALEAPAEKTTMDGPYTIDAISRWNDGEVEYIPTV